VVDADSVDESNDSTAFTLSYAGQSLNARYDGVPGGVIRDCAPVIVHGRIEDDVLLADRIEIRFADGTPVPDLSEGAGC
jgi:cytochrome c-type biogenesis protein CcmE